MRSCSSFVPGRRSVRRWSFGHLIVPRHLAPPSFSPLSLLDIDSSWLKNRAEITQVVHRHHPRSLTNEILGEPLDRDWLTSSSRPRKSGGCKANGYRGKRSLDRVSLHAPHRRWIYFHVLNLLWTSWSENRWISFTKTETAQSFDTIALPVHIFHPVSRKFSDRINDTVFKPSKVGVIALFNVRNGNVPLGNLFPEHSENS